MKYAFLIVALFLACAGTARAQTSGEYFTISSFGSDVKISSEGKTTVKETIAVDFLEPRHGIFRLVPYKYGTGLTRLKVRYDVLSVTNEEGRVIRYEVTREGNDFKIRIGDPDKFVSGRQVYVITYELERVINFFEDHDEFYFNVTGNGWPTTIDSVEANIELPEALAPEALKVTGFTGVLGSTESVRCGAEPIATLSCWDAEVSGGIIKFKARNLSMYEGFTSVLGWPKGIVRPPSTAQKIFWFVTDNWIFLLPALMPLLAFYIMMRIWRKYGRDPKGTGITVTQYSPPTGVGPALAGTLIDERADMRDVIAAIIDLARKGFIRIVEQKKKQLLLSKAEYKLVKLKDADSKLAPYEVLLLNSLFDGGQKEVTKTDLENKFYKDLKEIKSAIYAEITKAGYFESNPDKSRKQYSTWGFVLLGGAGLLLWIGIGVLIWPVMLGLALSGAVVLIIARIMPKKTKAGLAALEHVKGFEEFMNTAEKHRSRFAENANIFTDYLPYAIAFNVVGKWANAFEGIYKGSPGWYQSDGTFSAIYFANSMNDFSSSFGSAMASSPRSSASGGDSGFSGGGFSGGGFGGGGGGSW